MYIGACPGLVLWGIPWTVLGGGGLTVRHIDSRTSNNYILLPRSDPILFIKRIIEIDPIVSK